MTTYEPGTVAVATVRGVPNVRVVRGEGIFSNNWYSNRPVSGSLTSFGDSEVTDVRPLVTLDPEDREQVERLWLALRDARALQSRGNLIAALRSLLAPPTPEEPTGLGAVVEDSHGERYTRIGVHDDDSTWACARTGAYFSWLAIPAVRILSEGWSE